MKFQYLVKDEDAGKPVKAILKSNMKLSGKLIKRLKYNQKIFCSGIPIYVNHLVKTGDIIEVNIDFEEETDNIIPENMQLNILYEDQCIVAIDKPADIVVHPTGTHLTGTIANGLMFYYLSKNLKIKIRPVSRLDRGTSGVIIFAKNQFIQESLIRQMNDGYFEKKYLGVVHGIVADHYGKIDLPIDRKPGSIMLRHISENGYRSVTNYRVIKYLNNASLLEFSLETGRTHQIRVHCQALGNPLYGDTLYSHIGTCLIQRQALHSHSVKFTHPLNGEIEFISSPLPDDIIHLLEILGK